MTRIVFKYNRLDLQGNIIDSGTANHYVKEYGFFIAQILGSAKNGTLIRKQFRFVKDLNSPQPVKRIREYKPKQKEKTERLVPKTTKEVYLFGGAYHELIYGSSGNLILTKFLKQA